MQAEEPASVEQSDRVSLPASRHIPVMPNIWVEILKHEILSGPKLFVLNEQHPIKPVGFDP